MPLTDVFTSKNINSNSTWTSNKFNISKNAEYFNKEHLGFHIIENNFYLKYNY